MKVSGQKYVIKNIGKKLYFMANERKLRQNLK